MPDAATATNTGPPHCGPVRAPQRGLAAAPKAALARRQPPVNENAAASSRRRRKLPELDFPAYRDRLPSNLAVNPPAADSLYQLIYQQLRANPICRFHLLDPLPTCHGFGSAAMRFRPDEFPWAVRYRVLGFRIGSVVMFFHTAI